MDNETPLQRILILDDDRDYRTLIRTFLSSAFPDVVLDEYDPVENGIPGPDFDWPAYDILILDYNLRIENTTGLDILQENRESHRFPATIMLTGAGDEDIAVRALKSGVHDYLRKDKLKKSQLKDAILNAHEQHLANRERLDALDSVRDTARKEAARILQEYKAKFDDIRKKEEGRLKAELARLEKELQQKQEVLLSIMAEKESAEQTRDDAVEEINQLKSREQQLHTENDTESMEKLRTDLNAAREKVSRLDSELSESRHLQENAEAELLKANWKREQEEAMHQNLQQDLTSFKHEIEEQETNYEKLSNHLRKMRDLKAEVKARRLDEERRNDDTLLKDVSHQLNLNKD